MLVLVELLAAGQAFHRAVQPAFLSGRPGASGFSEPSWRLMAGRRGRVDLAVEVDGSEQMLVIIEIKATGWNKDAHRPPYAEPPPPSPPAAGVPGHRRRDMHMDQRPGGNRQGYRFWSWVSSAVSGSPACVRTSSIHRSTRERRRPARPVVSSFRGMLGLLSVRVTSAPRRGMSRARKSAVSRARASTRLYGGVLHMRFTRISSMGCSPRGLPYSNRTPRNREVLRPESADSVIDG